MSNPDQAPGYDGEPTYDQDEYNEYLRWREETEPQTKRASPGPGRDLLARAFGFQPGKQTVEDQRRSAATVAKTVAKALNSTRRTWTTLEFRPSL
jgi:hypothetical protein